MRIFRTIQDQAYRFIEDGPYLSVKKMHPIVYRQRIRPNEFRSVNLESESGPQSVVDTTDNGTDFT